MYRRDDKAYFRCNMCKALSPMRANLAEFDAAEFVCDYCGEGTWIDLDTVLNENGERYVSYRPIVDDVEYDTLGDGE